MKRVFGFSALFATALLLGACGSAESESAQSDASADVAALQPEGAGSVTGTIGGEEVNLYVLGSQSDHGNAHISLYVLGDDLKARGLGSLTLGAEWIGDVDGDFSSADVTIRIPDTSPSRIYYGSLDDGLSLTVTNSTLTGDTLEIAGRVKGTLTSMDLMGGRNPHPADTLDIDLSFDAAIGQPAS